MKTDLKVAMICLGFSLTKQCPRHVEDEECAWCYDSGGKIFTAEGEKIVNKIRQALTAKGREERARALLSYKRLLRSLMGDDIADEFSEKMAKGWDNLMKYMDEESAIEELGDEG